MRLSAQYRYRCRHSGALMASNAICAQRKTAAKHPQKHVALAAGDTGAGTLIFRFRVAACLDCPGAQKLEVPIDISVDAPPPPAARPGRAKRHGASAAPAGGPGPKGQGQVRDLGKKRGRSDPTQPGPLPPVRPGRRADPTGAPAAPGQDSRPQDGGRPVPLQSIQIIDPQAEARAGGAEEEGAQAPVSAISKKKEDPMPAENQEPGKQKELCPRCGKHPLKYRKDGISMGRCAVCLKKDQAANAKTRSKNTAERRARAAGQPALDTTAKEPEPALRSQPKSEKHLQPNAGPAVASDSPPAIPQLELHPVLASRLLQACNALESVIGTHSGEADNVSLAAAAQDLLTTTSLVAQILGLPGWEEES